MDGPGILRVRPAAAWNGYDWREMWERREVVGAVMRREIQSRYRQTVAGVVWVIGQPLLTTLVLSLLLTRLAGRAPSGVPYPLFVYAAMAPWAYLSHALTKSASCFIEHAPLVNRVYLPRLLLPAAVVLAALVDFGVALLAMPVLMLSFGVPLSPSLLALPPAVLLMVLTAFGIGVWLAVLNATYRDIYFALPFLLQLGLFVSPVFYSAELIPAPWRWLYALNPVVGIIEGMRWALLGAGPSPAGLMLVSASSALAILLGGLWYFQGREPCLADVI